MDAVYVTRVYVLSDPKHPRRAMTVDFDAFVERLVSQGEPEQERLDSLMAGVDLIRALESESDDFGAAAPGADERANFAGRVRALTDEALEAAGALIEEAGEYAGGRPPAPGSVLARAACELAFDHNLHPALVESLTGIPQECDPSAGGEFV